MKNIRYFVHTKKQQCGAVLAVSLMILFILTLIAITSLHLSSLDQRMTANIRDSGIALQMSEAGLRSAEQYIESLDDTSSFGKTAGLYQLGTAPDPFIASTWTSGNSIAGTTLSSSSYPPRYFIENLGSIAGSNSLNVRSYGTVAPNSVVVFRIVSQGVGPSGTSQVLIVEFYGKQF